MAASRAPTASVYNAGDRLARGSAATNGRVTILDPMRGIAAFSVAWFHFTWGNPALIPHDHPLAVTGQFGYLGVEMFFVISGFVIPFALYRSNYRIGDYPRFLLKRILRIDPPYFCTIALGLALAWVGAKAPGFAGEPFRLNLPQLVSHVGYWTQLARYQWLNIVFWTLAIEAQFYLVMGLAYRAIDRSSSAALAALVIALLLSRVIPSGALIFAYAPLFATGFIAYRVHTSTLGIRPALLLICALFVFQVEFSSTLVAVVGSVTGAIIALSALPRERVPKNILVSAVGNWLSKLGAISYSLYLLHVPIGGRVINLGARFAHTEPARIGVLVAAVLVSIAASVVFYRLVELPSQRWASSVRVHKEQSSPLAAPVGSLEEAVS